MEILRIMVYQASDGWSVNYGQLLCILLLFALAVIYGFYRVMKEK